MSDAALFARVVPEIANIVSQKIEINLSIVSKGAERQYNEREMTFILGYITAISDIFAQHGAGGEPGGSISQSVAACALNELFGEEQGEQLFDVVGSYMSGGEWPSEFEAGMESGAEDTSEWVNSDRSYGIGKRFISFFGE